MNINTEKPTKLEEIKESIYQKLIADFGEIPAEVEDNQYEARIEERRERFEDRAGAATARSNAAYQASGDAVKGIPLGQPILIGHHSERGHRRALERSDNGMRRSIQEQKKSEHYAGRAAAVGSAGIDSTDPDAVRKLMLKLLNLQIKHEIKKAANKIIRSKAKKYPDQQSKLPNMADLGFSEVYANALFEAGGFPAYELSNNSANMKRIGDRIKSLEKLTRVEEKTHSFFGGWLTVEVDKNEGRVFLRNEEKPSDEVRAIYKRNGYKWSPNNGGWSRKLTAQAVNSVGPVRRQLAVLGEANF